MSEEAVVEGEGSTGPLLAYGYHGTHKDHLESIKGEGFRPSKNYYDWLGHGIYFWQDAPRRAWRWAIEKHGANAAVVRAEIDLQNVMDLLDVGWGDLLREVYDFCRKNLERAGRTVPTQKEKVRRLDCFVLNYALDVINGGSEEPDRLTGVRAAFQEGKPVYPDSGIYNQSHVQIALIDASAIIDLQAIRRPYGEP